MTAETCIGLDEHQQDSTSLGVLELETLRRLIALVR